MRFFLTVNHQKNAKGRNGEGKADVFANAIKHDFKSPNPTTSWSDVIPLNLNAKKK